MKELKHKFIMPLPLMFSWEICEFFETAKEHGEQQLLHLLSLDKLLAGYEQFNMLGNDHGHTQMRDFSVFDWKHLFWVNLVQKLKIVTLS